MLLRVPDYRRPFAPGGTFFFTLVTQDRRPFLATDVARPLLRAAIADMRRERPFVLLAIVLLADHLHLMLELPAGDADFATRLAAIKARFTRAHLAAGGGEGRVTADRAAHGGRGVWQPRYFEHLIRDEDDRGRHLDYLHYNPVKHDVSTCPHAYAHSTFQKWVDRGAYEPNWACCCHGTADVPDFGWADGRDME